jgi:acetyl-CoA acyltransferase
MSRAPFVMPKAETAFSRNAEIYDTTIGWRFVNPLMKKQYGVDSMPETGENVAEEFGVSRAGPGRVRVSEPAARRWRRRIRAGSPRRSSPVTIPQRKGDPVIVSKDEHPRAGTTIEALAKLGTPFKKEGGTVTAGNASGVNDGAAALIIASEAEAAKEIRPDADRAHSRGRRPPACRRASWASGRPGDAEAVRAARAQAVDFDVVELNEAFASQGSPCCANSALPTTRSTSTRTAAPLRSAIRSACRVRASPARRRWNCANAAASGAGDDVHRRRPGHRDCDREGMSPIPLR